MESKLNESFERKTPNSYGISSSVNPFERETPFRQSISEKRRLTQQANTSAVQWKQQSFHETRTNSERSKYHLRLLLPVKSRLHSVFRSIKIIRMHSLLFRPIF